MMFPLQSNWASQVKRKHESQKKKKKGLRLKLENTNIKYCQTWQKGNREIIYHKGWTNRASQVVLVVRNLPANAGDARDLLQNPWHGNPFQYSCLENPMNRGAWKATVHGITQSLTQLKQLSTHTCWINQLYSFHTRRLPVEYSNWSLLLSWKEEAALTATL